MNTNKKMKYKVLYLFLAFFVLCGSHLAAQTPEYRWGRYFKGNVYSTGSHYDIIHSTAFDSAGNVYVFGQYGVRGQFDRSIYICPMDDTVGFQQANVGFGCFLAKFDTMGTLLWCKSLLSQNEPRCHPLNMVLKGDRVTIAVESMYWPGIGATHIHDWYWMFDTLYNWDGAWFHWKFFTVFATFDLDGNRTDTHFLVLNNGRNTVTSDRNWPQVQGIIKPKFAIDADKNICLFGNIADCVSLGWEPGHDPYIQLDNDTNRRYYLGYSDRYEDQSHIGPTASFLKIDSNWNLVAMRPLIDTVVGWQPYYEGHPFSCYMHFRSVNMDEEGNMYVCGWLQGAFDWDTINPFTFPCYFFLDSVHSLKVESFRELQNCPFIIKYDGDGNVLWVQKVYVETNTAKPSFPIYDDRYNFMECAYDSSRVYSSIQLDVFNYNSSNVSGVNRFYADSSHLQPIAPVLRGDTGGMVSVCLAYDRHTGEYDTYYDLFDYDSVQFPSDLDWYPLLRGLRSLTIRDSMLIGQAVKKWMAGRSESRLCKINLRTRAIETSSPIIGGEDDFGIYSHPNGYLLRCGLNTTGQTVSGDGFSMNPPTMASFFTFFYDPTLDTRRGPCPEVDSLWVAALEGFDLTLAWQGDSSRRSYELAYIADGTDWADATVLTLDTALATLALPANGCYHFRVRALCAYGEQGPWSDSLTVCPQVGISDPDAPSSLFALTPNPARESVTVTLDGADLPAEITVYDAAGHAVQSRRATTRRTRLSTRCLPAGHYFVTVATPQATATQKLVIK